MSKVNNKATQTNHTEAPSLKRAIGLPRLILYGLGVTIGAGIYVLVGETAGRAGIYAPASFLVAAVVMAFSAASFAEFSGRIPQSAGEAVFVAEGFRSNWLSALTGYAIILAGIVAAAAIGVGCAGYVALLIDLPRPIIISGIVCCMGLIAVWGIKESITIAGVLTVIEVIGLLVIIGAGFQQNPSLIQELPNVLPISADATVYASIISATLIAFFAFVGFDDVVNIVEETIDPARVMPWAIGITLIIVTVLYFFVSLIAVDALGMEELATSEAPVGLLFERLTGISPVSIALIAIAATLNGVVIQFIMASRVAYGLGKKGLLPAALAKVDGRTRTPVNATILVTACSLILALFVPLDRLAEITSQIILAVFLLVNISLVLVKWRGDVPPANVFTVPMVVPFIGATSCFLLLIAPLLLSRL